jgi:hypothetical protein
MKLFMSFTRKMIKGLTLKLIMKKPTLRLIDFLFEVLELRGFSPIFIGLIRKITQGGSVGVKLNDMEGYFFLTNKGLDPISPLLFNCVVDVFSRMLIKGIQCGLIKGRCPNFILAVVSLQYANDTLLFLQNDARVALNLRCVLTCF